MVPKPHTQSAKPKKNIPASPLTEKVNVSSSSSTVTNSPAHEENSALEAALEPEAGIPKSKVTLAEEFNHFIKTNSTASEEEVMAFMISGRLRRRRAGLAPFAAMEPLGNAAKPLSFYPLDFDTAVSALLKVKPPTKEAKSKQ